jgi:hypothetical protein
MYAESEFPMTTFNKIIIAVNALISHKANEATVLQQMFAAVLELLVAIKKGDHKPMKGESLETIVLHLWCSILLDKGFSTYAEKLKSIGSFYDFNSCTSSPCSEYRNDLPKYNSDKEVKYAHKVLTQLVKYADNDIAKFCNCTTYAELYKNRPIDKAAPAVLPIPGIIIADEQARIQIERIATYFSGIVSKKDKNRIIAALKAVK